MRLALALLAAGVVLTACGHGNTENEANVSPPPTEVVVATVHAENVPISNDYEGALGAIESVELRARVEGTLDRAPFKEGTLVQKGDLVFQIQQNQYLAALQAAQAQVAAAQANLYSREAALVRANTTVARDRPLAADKAIPQKDLDNAIQSEEIAKGDVARQRRPRLLAGQAAVDDAKINLGYTTIYAPGHRFDRIRQLRRRQRGWWSRYASARHDQRDRPDQSDVCARRADVSWRCLPMRNSPDVRDLADQDLRLVMANDQTYPLFGKDLHLQSDRRSEDRYDRGRSALSQSGRIAAPGRFRARAADHRKQERCVCSFPKPRSRNRKASTPFTSSTIRTKSCCDRLRSARSTSSRSSRNPG